MFKKVLIVDDFGSVNHGVASALKELGVSHVEQAQYCDDAFLKVKRADLDGHPFELLISDLSFKADHRNQKYPGGEALVAALRKSFPKLKLVVYSVEDRLGKVKQLMTAHKLDAYVCKGRHGLIELHEALQFVKAGNRYCSPQVKASGTAHEEFEMDDYDVDLVKFLSMGLSQEQISKAYREQGIKPNSLSAIEKRLNRLRIQFKAKNAVHLVAIFKDMGLI